MLFIAFDVRARQMNTQSYTEREMREEQKADKTLCFSLFLMCTHDRLRRKAAPREKSENSKKLIKPYVFHCI